MEIPAISYWSKGVDFQSIVVESVVKYFFGLSDGVEVFVLRVM